MDRDTGRVALIALLCCLAVVLVAATLPSMVENGGSGGGFGGADGGSDVEEQSEPPAADSDAEPNSGFEFSGLCVAFLDSELGFLALALGAVGIAALVTRSYDTKLTLMLSVALLPLVVLVFVVLTGGCGTATLEPPAPPADMQPPAENESGGPLGGGDGDGPVSGPTLPSLLVLTVLLVTIVGAFAALFYGGDDGSQEPTDSEAEPDDDDVQRSALGRAAGQAADRIEEGDDFENDVYRAWREMTEPLAVDRPDSSTPGEFAAAAREAGLDPSHVDELRTMFEDVRYGDRPVTDDRERRAVEILRRIESVYADDGDTENGATR